MNRTACCLAIIGFVVFLAVWLMAAPGPIPAEPGLIPKPVQMKRLTGEFRLTAKTRICWPPTSPEARSVAEFLAGTLRPSTTMPVALAEKARPAKGDIQLTTAGAPAHLGQEGYQLESTTKGVVIRANAAAGLFYGVQTLLQLLPPEIFARSASAGRVRWALPAVQIEDYPRFAWRGMHLDVSRHFFDVAFVKRYLDNLARHKMNVFHWHLTDDDGWRVEIKQFPKLTEVGAWRGEHEALPPSYESGPQRYGGFYTQDQIREVVRYAAEQHILVVPEIDVPAHSRAAIVVYPDLLCTGDPYQFKSVQDVRANVLCPSQERTYQFLEAVFGELAELFPGPYIHVGGDERPAGPWEQCDRCKKRMQDEHLANGAALQDLFLRRLQDFLKGRGKQIIGWDELDHPTVLQKDYTVMAWNSIEAGIAAAQRGYPVLMAPAPFNYLDLAYSEDPAEPGLRWAGVIPIEKTYACDPKPANLPREVADRIRGVHGCLWAEMLVTPDRPDYMAYPRLCALAELGWTPQASRAWPDFWSRLSQHHFDRLDAAGIAYRIPPPSARQSGSRVTITLPYENAQVRYTTDGSEPTAHSPVYQQPFELPPGAVLKMRTFRPDGRGSRTITGIESAAAAKP